MERYAEPKQPPLRRTGIVLLRAFRSTILIAAIALTLFALRHSALSVTEIRRLAVHYSPLWAAVFFGLLIWEYWFERMRRRP
jgi:hypothetical protein